MVVSHVFVEESRFYGLSMSYELVNWSKLPGEKGNSRNETNQEVTSLSVVNFSGNDELLRKCM